MNSVGPSKPWQNSSYDNILYHDNTGYSNPQKIPNDSECYRSNDPSNQFTYDNSKNPFSSPPFINDFSNLGESIRQLAQYLSNLSYSLHSLLSSIDSIRFIFVQSHLRNLFSLIHGILQRLKNFSMGKNKTIRKIIFFMIMLLFCGVYSIKKKMTLETKTLNFKVLKDFYIKDSNFLELHRGETVLIESIENVKNMDEWIYGRKDNGQSGYFPRSHIVI